jgi:hypothetical protein
VTFVQGKLTSRWTYTSPDTNHLVLTGVDQFRPVDTPLAGRSRPAAAKRDSLDRTAAAALDTVRISLRRLDLMSFRLMRGK